MSDDFASVSADRDELVRRRAYQIWEEGGRKEGTEEENWRQAALEIDKEMDEAAATAPLPLEDEAAASAADPREAEKPVKRGRGRGARPVPPMTPPD
jgi:hypothetical protein